MVFGKLPAHGDFIARGLDSRARAAWDAWASTALEEARAALHDRFEAAHDSAPPWRFISGPGPFGPGWRVGALAPSVDAAGRRFVVVVAADGLAPTDAEALAEPLAEAMEGLIYRAFGSGYDADALAAAAGRDLAAARGALLAVGDMPAPRWWTVAEGEQARLDRPGAEPPADWLSIAAPPAPGAGPASGASA